MRSRLPPVLGAADLPLAELGAARLDGELFPLDEGFCPIDEPDRPALRAAALRPLVPPGAVVERASALWVHGALPRPPARHTLCVPADARIGTRHAIRLRVRECRLSPDDVAEIAGLRLVTPLRAAVDLLRSAPDFGPRERAVIELLNEAGGFRHDDLEAAVEAGRSIPGIRRARERLRGVEGGAA